VSYKILFIIPEQYRPSSRIRVCNLLDGLKKHGIEPEVVKYPRGLANKLRLFWRCKDFDAVYLQKRLLKPRDVFLLRHSAAYLIFDFDDAIYCDHESTEIDKTSNLYHKFKSIISRADLIVAGNKILKEAASEFSDNIEIIPSAVFVKNIPQKSYTSQDKNVIIGWVGSSFNLQYLSLLSPILKKLSDKHDIQLRIVCDEGLEMDGVVVKFVPWDIKTQDREIANFDIGVMPLPDSLHTSGKCGYKALQYMAAAVPAVVSDVGINSDLMRHGKLGCVAKNIGDFYEALEHLIASPEERMKKGEASRLEVEEKYSIEEVSHMLAAILRKNIP
jgi:glycosyltransferase involved in cell wall biosynthesis